MNTAAIAQALDYRSPGTPGLGGDSIYRWLCTRHCLGVSGALLGIAVGSAVIVGGAWVVSGVAAWFAERLVSTQAAIMVGWPTFWIYLLVVTPLLVWRTLRTGGEFYEQQVLDSNLFHGKPSSYGSWAYRGDVASTALYIDLLFWGPRLLIDGIRRLAGRDVVKSAARLRRASFILAHLLRASEAVRAKALRIPDEPQDEFQRVLAWLERHDYVGISSDGQRVWISSRVRDELCTQLRIQPARPRANGPAKPQLQRFMDKREMVDIIFKR